MKTFKGYITEAAPAWTGSLSDILFDLPRAGIIDVKIPLSPSIFKRIWPKSIRSTAFHVTDYAGVEKLIKMQGKKRSISAFYNMSEEMIEYGIQTEGGYVVELEGDVLVAAPDDISTQPDKSGRRWIVLSTLMNNPDDYPAGLGGKTKLKGIKDDIESLLVDIMAKNDLGPYKKALTATEINKGWIYLGQSTGGKEKSLIIKDYIDGMEKIMKKNSRKLGPLFTDYTKKRTLKVDPDSGDIPQWDELVVNNFKIIKVHVSEVYADDFRGDDALDMYGLSFTAWDSNASLMNYISKTVQKGT